MSVIVAVVFLMVVRSETQGWSLSCALSEIVAYRQDGTAKYASSSSRFIAFFGFIILFWIYAGIGLLILVGGGTGKLQFKDIEGFLFFGLAMFAPYIANQVKGALTGFGKGLPTGLETPPK